MAYYVNGIQHCESTSTTNTRVAQKILNLRMADIIEGRFQLPKSNPPRLEPFSQQFLESVGHQNTRKRYASSVAALLEHFGDATLTQLTFDRIEEFKEARLAAKVRAATVNRDLAVLRHMLKIAERKRLLSRASVPAIEMLEERKERRQPHILTFEEEEKLLAAAPDHIRALVILILETGLRSGREACT